LGKISDALDKIHNHQDTQSAFIEKPANDLVHRPTENQGMTFNEIKNAARPVNNKKVNKNLVAILKPQSFESEQFRMLKSKLLFPASGVPPKSILVTSALPGEGKSFVSSNLAISIAQNINEHVLLVDGDIRSPMIHRYFGFSHSPKGLSDYLSKDIPLSSLFLKTDVDKLSILPGGTIPFNPAELLSSGKMAQLVGELIERYHDRYIIIDSPPTTLTSETNALSKMAEKILVVVNYRKTKREMVADLIETIGKDKIIGIVLNKCEVSEISYRYGKYYKDKKYFYS
jgi:exopolysaccharide/PEP-CTERM locus tyrosine autokinase